MDLIIGAGITGLSYAMFKGDNDYIIIEKESEIGGYCRTTKRNGFVWDFSGHFFHFQNPEIKDLILEKMDKDEMVSILKETKIKYKDLLIDYPFQKNIHQLDKEELLQCLFDLFTVGNNEFDNFQEMLYCKFGKAIAEKFLIPYNEKLYACDLNKLDKNAMGRFFPYANKEDIIRNFKSSDNASYNGHFVYPRGGAIEYINSVAARLDKSKIHCGEEVQEIKLSEHLVVFTNGRVFKYDRLISTLPFPELLKKTNIVWDQNIYNWNQVLCFNLGFNTKGKDSINHWLYFPEKKYCFYRVGFYNNILAQNRMSLYVELGFNKDEKICSNEWLGVVLKDLKDSGIVDDSQFLLDFQSIIMNPAYVHINKHSVADVVEKKNLLAEFDIYSIGRYGSWTYCSIEDNIIEAKNLACKLS